MSTLNVLKLVNSKKPTSVPPILHRRYKLSNKVWFAGRPQSDITGSATWARFGGRVWAGPKAMGPSLSTRPHGFGPAAVVEWTTVRT